MIHRNTILVPLELWEMILNQQILLCDKKILRIGREEEWGVSFYDSVGVTAIVNPLYFSAYTIKYINGLSTKFAILYAVVSLMMDLELTLSENKEFFEDERAPSPFLLPFANIRKNSISLFLEVAITSATNVERPSYSPI